MPPPEPPPLSREAFQDATSVSRETLERLDTYRALLEKWQPKINLVASGTLRDVWRRHFLDSAQLLPLLPESAQSLVDLGSGAGFPGLVLAILGVPKVWLIESDQRKIAFLRTVAQATATKVEILSGRIEQVPRFTVDVVTARALAPLAQLIEYGLPFLGTNGVCLFLKGRQAECELAETQRPMMVQRFESRSDPSGVVLRLHELSPT